MTTAAQEVLPRIVDRGGNRTEADLQSDIKLFLLTAQLDLGDEQVVALEVPLADGTRRRIDIEIGHAVIEVKRDLRRPGVLADSQEQLRGYVQAQTGRLGTRYVGILTDGVEWRLHRLQGEVLAEVSRFDLNPSEPDVERLTVWLESIFATAELVKPTPAEIERRLGISSPGYRLDHSSLSSLYADGSAIPEIDLKRSLWAKLLRTALGSAFSDDSALFVDHTLLVLTAEIVAHAVMGFDLLDAQLSADSLVRGDEFSAAQIHGVVEADFFDWILEVPEGRPFVASLARRLARFDWSDVEHDVLKVLYESVISREARHDLGEYYTPDWLAEQTVAKAVKNPLTDRVLDPSCGSGTFVFHAVRAFLAAADADGKSNLDALRELPERVIGVDVHPVSVTLARVTYLLAIGSHRLLANDRPEIVIPVYLGDSVQWDQHAGWLSQGEVRVPTSSAGDLASGQLSMMSEDLIFPQALLEDALGFDRIVTALADRALTYSGGKAYPNPTPIYNRYGVSPTDRDVLTATFQALCRLHAEGRNHIWSYFVRNLVRPIWLMQPGNQVDVLIGNPPWLAYRYMTAGMQTRFTSMARDRGLLTGRLATAARDLSAFFVARCVELYLARNGYFAFVMPRAALSRRPYEGFRTGDWSSTDRGNVDVTFDVSWDLDGIRPHPFPVPAAVVFGQHTPENRRPLPTDSIRWTGRLPQTAISWAKAQEFVETSDGTVRQIAAGSDANSSPYKERFRQGAVLAPRVLLFVEHAASGPLGSGMGRRSVRSRPSMHAPWRTVEPLTGRIENQFVRPTYLGETIAPFRLLPTAHAVIPSAGGTMLTHSQIQEYQGLADWWDRAEQIWDEHKRESDSSALLDRVNFHNQLVSQLQPASNRVAYLASGTNLAAVRVTDQQAIIEHKLYWGAASSVNEARYLVALLNSSALGAAVADLQSRGQYGARDFDKYVWYAPIPVYDSEDVNHVRLSELAGVAENVAAGIDFPEGTPFRRARTIVRTALREHGVADEIEILAEQLVR